MLRRRYLVAYDIRSPHRLRLVAKRMEDFGDRAQYSVFLCDLTRADVADMTYTLDQIIDPTEDRILIVDLGQPDDTSRFEFLGRRRPLPATGHRVV
ncbi:CRISPR-associated protein, Cas2 family [Saccharopolyspora kobensis]|uniref:CRISPR-associated endoribonuclease Cas2 n=1 Tax=Saccharopolyspora kobensis TaxID=146035 RepID=A0A1H5VQG7_9PSEU|nr:CRISPR-associated endonuclease Cas2 [Saccharopolyspora kobensis]SEF89575.1 CRISPR-associated protein, Cas2 family [Saccharopolyspora kobensis]SFC58162.1 CRISPR-associated protein Cas2 [Saccharopolyspora kobensis]